MGCGSEKSTVHDDKRGSHRPYPPQRSSTWHRSYTTALKPRPFLPPAHRCRPHPPLHWSPKNDGSKKGPKVRTPCLDKPVFGRRGGGGRPTEQTECTPCARALPHPTAAGRRRPPPPAVAPPGVTGMGGAAGHSGMQRAGGTRTPGPSPAPPPRPWPPVCPWRRPPPGPLQSRRLGQPRRSAGAPAGRRGPGRSPRRGAAALCGPCSGHRTRGQSPRRCTARPGGTPAAGCPRSTWTWRGGATWGRPSAVWGRTTGLCRGTSGGQGGTYKVAAQGLPWHRRGNSKTAFCGGPGRGWRSPLTRWHLRAPGVYLYWKQRHRSIAQRRA